MGFWDLSDGSNAKDTGTEFEMPSGNLDPIPDNSDVLAMIESVKWDKNNNGDEYINAMWTVLEPEQFKNRKVFHKLWVTDLDPQAKSQEKAQAKRDKALRMLSAIDANAGGKLERVQGIPTDDDLAMALQDRPMVIKCMVWEMPDRERYGEFIRGNWIAAVKPKSSGVSVGEEKPKPDAGGFRSSRNPAPSQDLGDEIPF